MTLKELGFASYADYLKSPHWLTFKAKYKGSGRPQKCAVCGDRNYELHHHGYECLGRETVNDVTPLCREHHSILHAWMKDRRIPADKTPSVVAMMIAEPGFSGKKPVKTKRRSSWYEKRCGRLCKSCKRNSIAIIAKDGLCGACRRKATVSP